ncbi:PP2C family protein-serine/threonine phosphatase [Dactylosporangium sp. CA-233914]|uniref:PP2C family protein-serine/threonine phosphatase n=1 Tax=Dactylosporangium sp. CA-233914 TaxID=3239934 RepID=UPI003D8C7072
MDAVVTAAGCPACGEPAAADRYCEACGRPLAARGQWALAPDGVRVEADLGSAAAVTDRGRSHPENEDAAVIGAARGAAFAVVCDGVSATPRAGEAARAAVAAAAPALLEALDAGGSAAAAIAAAVRAAQNATARLGDPADPGPDAPSCTFVCAVADGRQVSVGWLGDSRAYWVPARGRAVLLTADDAVPGSGALLRWLGADATDTEPHLHGYVPDTAGAVVVCSDGLTRYPAVVAALAPAVAGGGPLLAARHLVELALAAGGHDNVTVAVLAYPPAGQGGSAT